MRTLPFTAGVAFLAALGACSANSGSSDKDTFNGSSGGSFNGSGAQGGTSMEAGGTSSQGGNGGLIGNPPPNNTGGNGGSVSACMPQGEDFDGDGFSIAQGDCNDCDGNANPGAFDVPGNGVDEDCNGTADDEVIGCDGAIPDIGYADPIAGAQAIGLCRQSDGTSWGVLNAAYVMADGSPGPAALSHGAAR